MLGLSVRYNNIMSLGVSYKPGTLRSSKKHTESQENILENYGYGYHTLAHTYRNFRKTLRFVGV